LYHISPTTGNPNRCSAKPGNCPFGDADKHFPDKESARKSFEKERVALVAHRRKPKVRVVGEAGEHNIYANTPKTGVSKPGEQFDVNYLSDRDADELLDWWQRSSRATPVEYSKEERRAIVIYQGRAFKEIGSALRTGTKVPEQYAVEVENLRRALDKAKLVKPITLFRGLKGEYADQLAALKPGDSFEERSFCSTTPSEKGAWSFTKDGGVMLQIEAPAGVNAVDLGSDAFSMDEDEILLAPQKLHVESVAHEILDGRPLTRVVARLK
jgi:hypothetical protein